MTGNLPFNSKSGSALNTYRESLAGPRDLSLWNLFKLSFYRLIHE
jgi:hypothetical protein